MKITKEEYMQMYDIVGASMEVHSQLGRGMEEAIYQEALQMELEDRNIPFEREKILQTYYKGRPMKKKYVVDFMANGIMIELKSTSELNSEHRAQLMNYMRITKNYRGLLINFGEKHLRTERYLYQPEIDDFILLSKDNIEQYILKEE